jgi:glutamate-1-semialdehyde 2,1-aminomutase
MTLNLEKSERAFARASRSIPGGVNSPVRALGSVGGTPFFAAKASGAHVTDVDGNSYIDYILAFGPLILGHGHPAVTRAVSEALAHGMAYGAPTEAETVLAELIASALPGVEKVRLVNSGTEATMSAIRVARGYTKREKIIKFTGCYHGHADYLLVKAGSGAATFGVPDSLGVPGDVAKSTISLPFNSTEAVEAAFEENPGQIACVIVEPVVGNMGCVPPREGFLRDLRELCTREGALLVLDEVMTGFRLAWGGAQVIYDVRPDLTCLGKVIGGGLPVGAYGGRAAIMDQVAPLGGVYQAGTLSGNPLSVAAGIAQLELLRDGKAYETLEYRTKALCEGLDIAAAEASIPVRINRVGSMFTLFFTEEPVEDWESAARADRTRFRSFFHGMRDRGVSLPPSQFEACFLSTAHTARDIDRTVEVARAVLASMA